MEPLLSPLGALLMSGDLRFQLRNPIFSRAQLMREPLRRFQCVSAVFFGNTGRSVEHLQDRLACFVELIGSVRCRCSFSPRILDGSRAAFLCVGTSRTRTPTRWQVMQRFLSSTRRHGENLKLHPAVLTLRVSPGGVQKAVPCVSGRAARPRKNEMPSRNLDAVYSDTRLVSIANSRAERSPRL